MMLDKICYAKVMYDLTNEKRGIFSEETIKDLLMAKHSLVCSQSNIGCYDCCTDTFLGDDGEQISLDVCMMNEIAILRNTHKIKTLGCCCGHHLKTPYIQVSCEFVGRMIELGYEPLPIDEHGNGQYCFKPKTNL